LRVGRPRVRLRVDELCQRVERRGANRSASRKLIDDVIHLIHGCEGEVAGIDDQDVEEQQVVADAIAAADNAPAVAKERPQEGTLLRARAVGEADSRGKVVVVALDRAGDRERAARRVGVAEEAERDTRRLVANAEVEGQFGVTRQSSWTK
jgi:hypothetical protein